MSDYDPNTLSLLRLRLSLPTVSIKDKKGRQYANGVYTLEDLKPLLAEMPSNHRCISWADQTPPSAPPSALRDWRAWLHAWIDFALGDVAGELADPGGIFRLLLRGARDAARMMPDAPPLPDSSFAKYSDRVRVADELKQLIEWLPCNEPPGLLENSLETVESGDPPAGGGADTYAEYRNGKRVSGELLTPKFTKERYNVSGKDLTTDPEAKKHRRRNPDGRNGGDYVYRYIDVTRIANRKDREE